MGANSALPAINEIAFFLNEYAPAVVAELSGRGPDYAELVRAGVFGGSGDEPAPADTGKGLRVRCDILRAAIDVAITQTDERSAQIQSKLGTARVLRFGIGICSAVAATGTAGFALLGKPIWTVLLALFSLFSNIASAASTTIVLGSARREGDLVESLKALARARSFASITARHLAAASKGEFPDADITAILKDANQQYRDLSKALSDTIF